MSNNKGSLERENAELRKRVQRIGVERAKIRDMATRIAAGVPGSTPTSSGEGVLERLRILTARRENVELRARIARFETEMETESVKLEQQITEMEQKLQESLSLNLIAPTAGLVIARDAARDALLDIRWNSTGPTGDRVRIVLLKRDVHFRSISLNTPNDGTFPWPIPKEVPPATDYKVAVQDPTSGLVAQSDEFEIR